MTPKNGVASGRAGLAGLIGLIGVAGAMFCAGCQTVESTRLLGAEEETGGASEELGEVRTFLEVVRPVPGYIARDESRRAAWREAPYEEDRRRTFHPFAIPTVYSISLDEFRGDPGQDIISGPHVEIQLRKRQLVTVSKTHQVVSRSRFGGDRETRNERIPIYSEWRWEPERAVVGTQPIRVDLAEFAEGLGVISRFEGTTDEQGRYAINLVPVLKAQDQLGSSSSVTLRVYTADLGLGIEIVIPSQVLFHYSQQQSLFGLTDEAEGADVPPPAP